MEIHQSIGQNTLSILVEKTFEFKVDSCPKNKDHCLSIVLISSDVSSHVDIVKKYIKK